jgi:menaquinone-dependent protoporphyrinogen IX oxidase
MKAAIVYDTHYGNTKIVAEAIAAELRAQGHQAELTNLREKDAPSSRGDVLFLGAPVRLGATKGARSFLEKLDTGVWGGKPVAIFTTILALSDDTDEKRKEGREKYDKGAGRKLADLAKSQGMSPIEDLLWVDVKGMKGPLVETGPEESRMFARRVLALVHR